MYGFGFGGLAPEGNCGKIAGSKALNLLKEGLMDGRKIADKLG